MKRSVEFLSKGNILRGDLVTPEGKGPFPTVVMAGGYCYVKEIVMPIYADFFAKQGIASLLFDYRNFGESEGPERQHINPWEQIEDYQMAITFAETLPEVDPDRIGVYGISWSGGHVLVLGAVDPRIKAIVSIVPLIDGHDCMYRLHGWKEFTKLTDLIWADRRNRLKTGKSGSIPMGVPDPSKELCVFPLPELYHVFMDYKQRVAPNHQHWSTIESVELFLQYNITNYLPKIINTPVMMICAEGDNITLWSDEVAAFNQIKSNVKELFITPKSGHMTLYSDQQKLEMCAAKATEWYVKHLKP